jgi:hypothetical protein
MTWEFWRATEPVAAREHKCETCGKVIAKGARHFSSVGKAEGHFMAYREHAECRAAWLDMRDFMGLDYDDALVLSDMDEPSDRAALLERHPIVAERLGIKRSVGGR